MKSLKTLLERLAQSSKLILRKKTRTTLKGGVRKQVAKNVHDSEVIFGPKVTVSQSSEYAAKYARLQELRNRKWHIGYDEVDQKEMDGLIEWFNAHPNC